MQLNWTIIGCGWLGVTLAEELVETGHHVFGSTTTESKLSQLNEKGIHGFLLTKNSSISPEIIEATNIVVLSIPPFNRSEKKLYGQYLCSIAKQFKHETRFIFLGSTGIYPQKSGRFDESYVFESQEKETALYSAEEQLSDLLAEKIAILRLGGLIGEDRHPIRTLSGKTGVKNPEGLINFVDKKDVIRCILEIEAKNAFGHAHTYNVVFPYHPQRKKYYTEIANQPGLLAPEFDHNPSIIREIVSEKLQLNFGFKFAHQIQ